jgi:hypothetical protein
VREKMKSMLKIVAALVVAATVGLISMGCDDSGTTTGTDIAVKGDMATKG